MKTTLLAISLILLTSCTSFEHTVTKETTTNTTHFIDYGPSIQDGVKISSNELISIVVYENNKILNTENKVLNGCVVLPPNRYSVLISEEYAISKILAAHPEIVSEFNAFQSEYYK